MPAVANGRRRIEKKKDGDLVMSVPPFPVCFLSSIGELAYVKPVVIPGQAHPATWAGGTLR
jgi:hypothetical protein